MSLLSATCDDDGIINGHKAQLTALLFVVTLPHCAQWEIFMIFISTEVIELQGVLGLYDISNVDYSLDSTY